MTVTRAVEATPGITGSLAQVTVMPGQWICTWWKAINPCDASGLTTDEHSPNNPVFLGAAG